jgi:hypothetical protein
MGIAAFYYYFTLEAIIPVNKGKGIHWYIYAPMVHNGALLWVPPPCDFALGACMIGFDLCCVANPRCVLM